MISTVGIPQGQKPFRNKDLITMLKHIKPQALNWVRISQKLTQCNSRSKIDLLVLVLISTIFYSLYLGTWSILTMVQMGWKHHSEKEISNQLC